MNAKQDGITYRSELFQYTAGNVIPLKMDFLSAARHMAAPEVCEILLEVSGTVGAVTGGALGVDAAKLFDNIRITDSQEWCNASGQEVRSWAQMELGARVTDPADIASATTSTTYRYLLPIPLELPRADRPRDTRVELDRFLAGGEFTIALPSSVPTGYNPVSFASGTSTTFVRVYFKIRDGRVRELKSRVSIRSQQVVNQDYEYPCNGSLRAAILGSKLTTTLASSWANFTLFYSRSLEFQPNWPSALLVDDYRSKATLALATADVFVSSTPYAIPFLTPQRYQKIGEMPDLDTLHVDMTPSAQSAAPTNARLLLIVIKDRVPDMAALVAGVPDAQALGAIIASRGRVVDGKPGGSPATTYDPTLVRRFPVRVG